MSAPNTVEVSVWCAGAWRLGRFDETGLAAFANTTDAAWRSFYAAIYIAPLWLLVSVMHFAVGETTLAEGTGLFQYLTVDVIAYIIGWTAFPVIMAGVCSQLGRESVYLRFIAAYNWSMLIQNMIYLPVILAGLIGLIPPQAAMLLTIVTLMWALAFEAFVLKSALKIPMSWAVGLTAFDLFLALMIGATADVVL